jgi:peptidoglycan/LPS O-acetylase OafA/YrhL
MLLGGNILPVLEQRFDPRRNSFDALRLILAGLVAIDHGIIIRTGIVHRRHGVALGDFAVDGFFVLSGFLVCHSYLRLQSLPRYLWHRGLRILPGFWVCLLLTALVAAPAIAVLEGRPAASVFTTGPTAQQYLTDNALLLMRQFNIAGLLADNPTPSVVDGALWTLFYEAICYALIAGLGVFGILAGRRWVILVLTAAVWAVNIPQAVGVLETAQISSRLALPFLLGTLAHVYANKLPVSTPWVLAAAAVFAVSLVFAEPYRIVGAAAFAYLLIWLGACAPFAVSIRTDLSYGLYIYHFLIFQIMMVTALAVLPIPLFVIVGTAISLALAAGSWFLIEHPALSRNSGPFIQGVETRLGNIKQALASRLPGRRSLKAERSADIVRSHD